MKSNRNVIRTGVILNAVVVLFTCAIPSIASDNQDALVHPEPIMGIKIEPIDNQPIPNAEKEKAKKHAQEMKKIGHINVGEDEIGVLKDLKKIPNSTRSMESVNGGFKVKPADLKNTPFADLKYEGVEAALDIPDAPSPVIARIFTMPNNTVVRLEEWDYTASGGGSIIPQEFINETVSGYPATLIIKKAPSGNSISELQWGTDRKIYTLTMTENVKKTGNLKRFMALAESIVD